MEGDTVFREFYCGQCDEKNGEITRLKEALSGRTVSCENCNKMAEEVKRLNTELETSKHHFQFLTTYLKEMEELLFKPAASSKGNRKKHDLHQR